MNSFLLEAVATVGAYMAYYVLDNCHVCTWLYVQRVCNKVSGPVAAIIIIIIRIIVIIIIRIIIIISIIIIVMRTRKMEVDGHRNIGSDVRPL